MKWDIEWWGVVSRIWRRLSSRDAYWGDESFGWVLLVLWTTILVLVVAQGGSWIWLFQAVGWMVYSIRRIRRARRAGTDL
jgi:hypothetical protein